MVNEEELGEYLTKCPLCKSNVGFKISGFPFKNNIECKSCEAKWKWKDPERVLLERYSIDGVGDFLLEVERPASFWSNVNIEHVDWKEIPKLSSPISQSLVLGKGEAILAGWNGIYDLSQFGSLVLTTQRLLWLDKELVVKGILRVERRTIYHLVHSLLLESLLQVLSSPFSAYSETVEIIERDGKKYSFRLDRMQDYPSCKPLIMQAIGERREKIESEKRRERVQLVLDFSSLKNYMEKGGLVMQTFRCPNCSAPVEFPEKGKTAKCDHCGSKIYARDIFEKIKELIG